MGTSRLTIYSLMFSKRTVFLKKESVRKAYIPGVAAFPCHSIVKEFSVIKKKSPIYFGPSPTTGWQRVQRDTICKNAEQTQGRIVTVPSHGVAAPSVQASTILVGAVG